MNTSVHPAAVERAMSAAMSLLASMSDDAEDEILKLDMLEGETDALEIVRHLVRVALDAQSMAAAAKARIDDLEARRDRFEIRANSARETVQAMLEALDIRKLQEPDFTVSLRPTPPKVLVPEPDKLPDEFWRVTTSRTVDKPLVMAALNSKRDVPGATLSNGGVSLQVRTK